MYILFLLFFTVLMIISTSLAAFYFWEKMPLVAAVYCLIGILSILGVISVIDFIHYAAVP